MAKTKGGGWVGQGRCIMAMSEFCFCLPLRHDFGLSLEAEE
jgi:hypothetical protein